MLLTKNNPIIVVLTLMFSVLPAFQNAAAEDLLIRDGKVVTAEKITRADVRVRGQKIVEIGNLKAAPGDRIIDARGKFILPGGVDPHVHLVAEPTETTMADDFTSGSKAAFAGGITTLGQMAFPVDFINEAPLETLERETTAIQQQAMADFFVHTTIYALHESSIAQLENLAERGQPSVKVFMPFLGPQDESLLSLLSSAKEGGVTVLIHCEDQALIAYKSKSLMKRGSADIRHYPSSRPAIAEELSTHKVARMAESTGATVYIVHLSAADALAAIGDVASPAKVYVETRPLYLHLTQDVYNRQDGQLYLGMPPIGSSEDQDALWAGLKSGTIDTLGSDHAAWTRTQKLDSSLNVMNFTTRAGVNDLQTMLPMLYSEGVHKGRISLKRFVEVTATNPAKIFGLYPRKGTIEVGSDADLVVWDPTESRTIQDSQVFSNAGFSIYSGRKVKGWPILTIRRGEIVFENGVISAEPGSGQLLHRSRHGT